MACIERCYHTGPEVPGQRGKGFVGGYGGPFDATPFASCHLRYRTGADGGCPSQGMADSTGWLGNDRRCTGFLFYFIGREGGDRDRSKVFGGCAFMPGSTAGSHPAATFAVVRSALVFFVPPAIGAVPLWNGSIQDRLGPG